MKDRTIVPATNGILMMAVSSGLAFLGGLISDILLYVGFFVALIFVVLWALSYKFNLFMEKPIKLIKYIRYDCKNGPIFYLFLLFVWVIVISWTINDFLKEGEIKYDTILGLYSNYIISCFFIFWGYVKDYERLP